MKVPPNQNLPNIEFTPTKQERFSSKKYAEMEPRTANIRKRLAKRLEQLDEKITDKALETTKKSIVQWLKRHSRDRVEIKKGSTSFFSGGKSVAEASPKVLAIRNKIVESFKEATEHMSKEAPQQTTQDLRGRVRKS